MIFSLLSRNLSMPSVIQDLISIIHDCMDEISLDILSGETVICNCKPSTNEYCVTVSQHADSLQQVGCKLCY